MSFVAGSEGRGFDAPGDAHRTRGGAGASAAAEPGRKRKLKPLLLLLP